MRYLQLNQDCVRSILLELEEKLTLMDHVYLHDLKEYNTFKEFGENQSIYAILKLIEVGYINGKPQFASNKLHNLGIASLTWEGHVFLDNIRDNKIWSKTKEATKNFSSISVTVLSKLANEYLMQQTGLR
ncbi:DUF2513 domain-containing protein [Paraliobacillus salinarum]|uniref:DUF2513 domain-containing protein n=1 Tax=Paraliobacillus salinarum TaxID=1158996 RepID=UPI001FEA073B|nr:DUF2513 domain-containing protein [Paraliobacillus salinarum]